VVPDFCIPLPSELDSLSDSDSDSDESDPSVKAVCSPLTVAAGLYEGKELDDTLLDFFAASFWAFSSAMLSALEVKSVRVGVGFVGMPFAGRVLGFVAGGFGFDGDFNTPAGGIMFEDWVGFDEIGLEGVGVAVA